MSTPSSTPGATPASDAAIEREYRFLRLDRLGGIARLTLDRPPVNVLNLQMLEELNHALAAVSNERSFKLLLLAGEGRAFCAGVDVADHTADRVEPSIRLFHSVVRRLLQMECPTIAAVHGATVGGGCELMLGCDVVLARDDVKIGQPEIQLGVFPPVGAALLPELIGRQRALDLVLSGRTLGAEEAYRYGLVNQVIAAEGFRAAVEEYIQRTSGLSGPVLRLAKRALVESLGLSASDAIDHAETLYLGELMRLEDAEEGLQAFLEKRAPQWREA